MPTCSKRILLMAIITPCLTLSIFFLLNDYTAYSVNDPSNYSSGISQGNASYWTIGKNMSTARNELATVVLNDKIYAMGGEDIAAGGGQKDA